MFREYKAIVIAPMVDDGEGNLTLAPRGVPLDCVDIEVIQYGPDGANEVLEAFEFDYFNADCDAKIRELEVKYPDAEIDELEGMGD